MYLSGMMMNKGSGNNSSGGFHPKPPDPVALTSLFKSVKKGVQTGVTAAVKAGLSHSFSPWNTFYPHSGLPPFKQNRAQARLSGVFFEDWIL